MLHTKDLKFSYDAESTFAFPDISSTDEPILILGNSGVGKSTLLHLLGGLMKPTDGFITISNTDITGLSGKKMDRFRGDNIGIVFQKSHFVSSLSVIENLTLAQYLAGKPENKNYAQELLERLNIGRKADQNINYLSEGEKQRVAIARALINNPKVILADEPTSALDDENCLEVIKLLKEQSEMAGAILIIVTHDGRLKTEIPNQINLNHS